MKHLLAILFLLPALSLAQTLNGKVYDVETTVKGALVVNISQNVMTYTNDEGDFQISAKVKDTLYVSSLFHTKSLVELKPQDFEDIMIIEVKKAINELDAVLLRDEREKRFDSIKMQQQLDTQIKEDIKRNPTKYTAPPKYGIDFIAIAKSIGSLFKRKTTSESIQPITYKTADSLFTNHKFFNKTLLTVDLNIPEDYHALFFEYLESKHINSKLLQKEQQIELLEVIVLSSQEFQKLLEDAKKKP